MELAVYLGIYHVRAVPPAPGAATQLCNRNRQQKSGSDGRVSNWRLFRSPFQITFSDLPCGFCPPGCRWKDSAGRKNWLHHPGSSAAIRLRPSLARSQWARLEKRRDAREAGKGCEGAVEPPVRGGRWAEPRSGRARSVVQPGPRHPAQAARLDSPRAGRSLVIAAEESGEKRRTRGVELVLLGRLQVSLGCLRPRHLCRTLRVEWGHRSSPVGLGLSAAPAAHGRHDHAFSHRPLARRVVRTQPQPG